MIKLKCNFLKVFLSNFKNHGLGKVHVPVRCLQFLFSFVEQTIIQLP
jgi:hypothetical protein